ncbi:hypothetical protein H5410_025825 [Solanum commersonii]|uniref:DUF4283 domain-containing protein n=1 Tax=Solanum commersonii TaxID=4109 RepID=A0A9J5YWY9_SOLCO|nr:hypothetical protein H5410_025825 [Solanum commersonii]
MVGITTMGDIPPEDFPPLPNQDNGVTHQPVPIDPSTIQYANLLKPKLMNPSIPKVEPKPVVMLHGEPNITWKSSEGRSLIFQENLQYAIIGKFSYGKPDIKELRRTIPGQCGIKSECIIGVLDTRHILIRLTTMEDYVNLLSTSAFYVKAKECYWQMRTLKWDPWFERMWKQRLE